MQITPAEFSALLTPLAPGPRVAIAVSGGSDSMCLAWLAKHAGLDASILTIDHGTQASSGDTARQVQEWMRALELPHHILRWHPGTSRRNLQARARDARYELLAQWCIEQGIGDLLTAHHRDDQAETLLLRLKRGSHIAGLAGMSATQPMHGIRLLRPLLSVPKARLTATLTRAGQPWREDATNALPLYERNRLRQLLSSLPDADMRAEALAASAGRLRILREKEEQARDAQRASSLRYLADGSVEILADTFYRLDASEAALLVSHAVSKVGPNPYPPRFAQAQIAAGRMKTTRRITLGGCLITWIKREGLWRVSVEKPAG